MTTESYKQESPAQASYDYNKPEVLNEQLWSAILPYLPSILIDSIHKNPERDPPWIDPIEGSLMLADISGFTRMSEQLAKYGKEGAEWLTDIINHYFHRMLDIAANNGGTNLKFGGDAILILFHDDNHAYRAINAALEMQRATRKFRAYRAGQHRFRLNMTVGVHSGTFWSVAAGSPGQRMQHFILGRETSYLCKTESSASAGQLYISKATLNLLSELCTTELHGDAYRVLRLKRLHINPVTIEHGLPPSLRTSELFAYLPPNVIESLRSGISLKDTIGEHRKVTIAFINLLRINELLDEQGPQVLLAEMQQYLSLIVRLTEQYGGFIASNDVYDLGLKLILVFGAPVAHEQDSANALRLALELNHEIARLNTKIHHRIGINSGFVFAGDIGPPYSRQYTIMGDAVNLAARLMSSADPDQVLLSGQVASEAGPSFILQHLPPIKVKGKEAPIPVCLLQGEQATEYHKVDKDMRAFLGREDEVESFKQVCQQVEQGKARTLVISGEAGIGKSRLFLEFREYMREWDWTIHAGACHSHTITKPFTPWIQILRSFFDINHVDDIEKRTEKVLSFIKLLIPSHQDEASLFNTLLDINIPLSGVVRARDEESRRNRLFELIMTLLQSAAKESPVVILMEDLHWADYSSIQLMNRIAAGMGSSHLLLCLTMRPTKEIPLHLPPTSTITINLTELPEQAALQLVKNILNRPDLPQHITDIIIAKAKGNPLFLEEIATSLSQSGIIDQILETPSSRVAEQMSLLDIPDRIQSVIMTRVDTITHVSKEVARAAAVIGYDFNLTTLQSFPELGVGPAIINTSLIELIHLGIVSREENAPEPLYRLKHALIQEVIYNNISFARRRKLHHHFATYLEEFHKEQLEPVFEVLAYHYRQSRDDPKTRTYTLKSAEKAQKVFAHEEAIEYYRRGLATLEGKDVLLSSQRSYFLERIGDCYESSGGHKKSANTYLRALQQWRVATRYSHIPSEIPSELVDDIPLKVREATLCHKIGLSYVRNSDYDSSLKWIETAYQVLPPRQPLTMAKINITKSVSLYRKGKFDEAIQWGRKGLDLSRRSGNKNQLAYAHNILAASYLELGQVKRSVRQRLLALELCKEEDDLYGQSSVHNNLGICYLQLGDLDKALFHFEEGLKIDERIGSLTATAIKHNNIGEVLLIQGSLEEAISHFQEVMTTFERTGNPIAAAGLTLVNLSRANQKQQHYKEAIEYLRQGVDLLKKAGDRGMVTEANLQEAELYLETGQLDSALIICRRALNKARQLNIKLLEARGLRIQGRIDSIRGHYAQAVTSIKHSVTITRQLNADYEKGLALLYLAELYGKNEKNRNYQYKSQLTLERAIAIFQRIGAKGDLANANLLKEALQS